MYGERRGMNRVLVGNLREERPLGRPRRRWEDNINMDFWDVRWGKDWFDMGQERGKWRVLVNTAMNLRVIYKMGNFLTS
jgi:hypothetical protein